MSVVPDPKDRRRFERKVPTEPIPIRDALTGETMGTIGNVSAEGLMIIGPRQINDGLLVQLAFSVESRDGETAHVTVGAESLWCSPALRPDSYWTGLKIIDISAQHVRLLEDLLDQL